VREYRQPETSPFVLLVDKCILERNSALAEITMALGLPKDVALGSDSHYQVIGLSSQKKYEPGGVRRSHLVPLGQSIHRERCNLQRGLLIRIRNWALCSNPTPATIQTSDYEVFRKVRL
jgi:hypothetical protein